MFSGEHDACDCYMDLQAGSGGTEAQDWTEMLLRMYLRWAESKGFKTELMEVSDGDVAGLKSATIKVSGEYAFGWLRTETGIHRLVRKVHLIPITVVTHHSVQHLSILKLMTILILKSILLIYVLMFIVHRGRWSARKQNRKCGANYPYAKWYCSAMSKRPFTAQKQRSSDETIKSEIV